MTHNPQLGILRLRHTTRFPYSGLNCDATCGNAYNKQYEDRYPYGYVTLLNRLHLTGGAGNLAFIANASNTFSAKGYTWATAGVSTTGKSAMILPATGGYVQFRTKMPDSHYGGWFVLWLLQRGVRWSRDKSLWISRWAAHVLIVAHQIQVLLGRTLVDTANHSRPFEADVDYVQIWTP
jgi:hypothetical protein